MAFRATNVLPSDAYQVLKRTAVQLQTNLSEFVTTMQVQDTNYDYLRGIYFTLTRAFAQFTELRETQGIIQYAKDQEDDQSYDVSAEFTSMQSSMTGAILWIETNVPTTVTAKPPEDWDNETMILNAFSPAQTSTLRTELDLVIAEII